jgi:hypothetical protein
VNEYTDRVQIRQDFAEFPPPIAYFPNLLQQVLADSLGFQPQVKIECTDRVQIIQDFAEFLIPIA